MTVRADGAPDLLSGGDDDAPPRRWPRLLLVLLLVVGVAVAAEGWERQRQRAALVAAAADAEQVVSDARRSLAGLVGYSSGTLVQTELGSAQREALLASFALDSQRFLPRMAARRSAVADVRVLPWDDELREAKAAYLARVDGWTALVAGGTDDPQGLLLERRRTRLQREQAAAALAALPGADEVTALLSR